MFFGHIWSYEHIAQRIKLFCGWEVTDLVPFNIDSPLYNSKKFLFRLWGLWYSKWPAWAHGFNAKIGFEKYASGPEIFTKMCTNLGCQTKPSYFETFWPISRDSVRIFQNRFLRWNRELKPVILSTMKPINGTKKNLTHKGPIWT